VLASFLKRRERHYRWKERSVLSKYILCREDILLLYKVRRLDHLITMVKKLTLLSIAIKVLKVSHTTVLKTGYHKLLLAE
jgi:hypothetical protein